MNTIETMPAETKAIFLRALAAIEKRNGVGYAPNCREIEIEMVRQEHLKVPRFSAGKTHEAYITETNGNLGVSFWTASDLNNRTRTNSDRTISRTIEPLYL